VGSRDTTMGASPNDWTPVCVCVCVCVCVETSCKLAASRDKGEQQSARGESGNSGNGLAEVEQKWGPFGGLV